MNTEDTSFSFIICPHCNCGIIIYNKDFNCKIFRHGVNKITGKQIEPHLDKEKCDQLVSSNKIHGCGKPFRLITNKDNIHIAEICGYI